MRMLSIQLRSELVGAWVVVVVVAVVALDFAWLADSGVNACSVGFGAEVLMFAEMRGCSSCVLATTIGSVAFVKLLLF